MLELQPMATLSPTCTERPGLCHHRVKRSMLICKFLRVALNLKSDTVVAVAARHHRSPPNPPLKTHQRCGLLICHSLHLLFLLPSLYLLPPHTLFLAMTPSRHAPLLATSPLPPPSLCLSAAICSSFYPPLVSLPHPLPRAPL